MSEQHTKEPCIAESVTADFTEGTWLFEPIGDFRVGSGLYALMPERDYLTLKQQRDELLAVLTTITKELRGPDKPYSADSYLPEHFIELAKSAIAKVKECEK